jgi:hypothetical protein
LAAANERFAGTLNVEAQAWLCAGPKPNAAELVAVFVDPRARDPKLGGEGRRVDQSAGGGTLAAHQLDHPLRDGLHGGRVKRGVGVGVALRVVGELRTVLWGHRG